MALLKDGALAQDPWQTVGAEDELPRTGPIILSLAQWEHHRDHLAGRNAPFGIRLDSDQTADAISEILPRLGVVVLDFPAFTDGRPFSTARILRERHGYDGELRAAGRFIPDQYQYLLRCGFDAFEVRDEDDAHAFLARARDISVWYQPASADAGPLARSLRERRTASGGRTVPEAIAAAE